MPGHFPDCRRQQPFASILMIDNATLLEEYRKLNANKSSKLIFHLTRRGFASELNNLLLAMLYCLVHDIEFQLDSSQWNGGHENGWRDYFLPFCTETFSALPSDIEAFSQPPDEVRVYMDQNYPGYLIVSDIWQSFRSPKFINQNFLIPELGIDGGIFHAKQVLLRLIYRHNEYVLDLIANMVQMLADFEPDVAVHIRRGDKIKEAEPIETCHYIDKIKEIDPDGKRIFVATDDYLAAEELADLGPRSWHVTTLCPSRQKGHLQGRFNSRGAESKRVGMSILLADLHYLSQAKRFLGTYSSNIARLVALLRGGTECYSLDRVWHPK